jgi:hypothetical protein
MRRLAALSVLALVALAACGGDDEASDTTAAATTDAPATTGTTASEETTSESTAADGTASESTASPETTTGSTADDEVGEDEAAYVDAIMEDFAAEDDTAGRCLSEAAVAAIGLEQLQSADVSPAELADNPNLTELGLTIEDRAAAEASIAACGDGYLILTLTGTEVNEANRACADQHISDEVVARVIVQSLSGEEPDADAQAAADAFDACINEG